jgi:hypothetical protein
VEDAVAEKNRKGLSAGRSSCRGHIRERQDVPKRSFVSYGEDFRGVVEVNSLEQSPNYPQADTLFRKARDGFLLLERRLGQNGYPPVSPPNENVLIVRRYDGRDRLGDVGLAEWHALVVPTEYTDETVRVHDDDGGTGIVNLQRREWLVGENDFPFDGYFLVRGQKRGGEQEEGGRYAPQDRQPFTGASQTTARKVARFAHFSSF